MVRSVCLQVLLWQEHHDEGARQEVCVQVRFPRVGSRDAAGGGRSGSVQIPERALHVRLRPRQAEPDAAAGGVGLGFRSWRPLPIGIELLVDEPGRQLVCRPSHGLRTRATSSRHLSTLRMTRRRALGCSGHAALKRFYWKSTESYPPPSPSPPPLAAYEIINCAPLGPLFRFRRLGPHVVSGTCTNLSIPRTCLQYYPFVVDFKATVTFFNDPNECE